MPSLTHKIIKGYKYYYVRICKRVNGRPKIVQTIYLGTVEKIIENAEGAKEIPKAKEVFLAEFGATAALLDLANRLQFVEIIDRHASKRDQGPSVGEYMLVAVINRATHPASKAAIANWFEQTAGPRLMGIRPSQLSSQAFWNHMDRLKQEALINIENEILVRLVDEFNIDLNVLLYDATNFYTYINTKTKSDLAHRGKNKQKRGDLRQVSLGMMTSSDFHVPLLHMVYGGNINDSTQFGSVIDELVKRYKQLTEACPHVTLIFDKGNNSEENIEAFKKTHMHFVGSLKLNQCEELLKVPLRNYRELAGEELEDVKAYRARHKVFAEERTVLITYNENLLAGQLQGIGHNIAKCREELHLLQVKLKRWEAGKIRKGRKPTLEGTKKKVSKILDREYMKKIITTTVSTTGEFAMIQYHVDQKALGLLTRTVLGKTILFTDNHEWTDEQIVWAYRAQYHIEHAFREMKNPHFLGWNPRFHWTDQKIRVHAFYCVAALTFVSLLRREIASKGLYLSAEKLMKNLVEIEETLSVYPQGNNRPPKISYSMSHLNEVQKKLYDLLRLKRFRAG
jgi:transposase